MHLLDLTRIGRDMPHQPTATPHPAPRPAPPPTVTPEERMLLDQVRAWGFTPAAAASVILGRHATPAVRPAPPPPASPGAVGDDGFMDGQSVIFVVDGRCHELALVAVSAEEFDRMDLAPGRGWRGIPFGSVVVLARITV